MKYLSLLPYPSHSLALRSAARSFATSQRMVVGYATDVEGNIDYWNQYLSVSKVLEKDSKLGSVRRIRLKDSCHFVYGGDACDRGPGCVRVLKDLVQLKEDYPERVHLILGNRDINKLRIQFSMHPTVLKTLPAVKWLKLPPEETVGPDYKLNDPESKMKWILSKTMGSPIAYEMCRMEAEETGNADYAAHPWKCFLDLTDPANGLLTRYLEMSQVAALIGDVLFVHGAKHEHNFGWLPPSVDSMKCSTTVSASITDPLVGSRRTKNLSQWVRDINAFVRSELRDYRQRAPAFLNALSQQEERGNAENKAPVQIWESAGGYHHPQPASRLLQYGMGRLAGGTLNPSVVYSTYLQQTQQGQSSKPNAVSAKAGQWLRANGMRAVVVGHQPVGDAPLIMQAHGVQMISMDTSYSRDVQWPASQLHAITTVAGSNTVAATDSNHACTAITSLLPLDDTVSASTEWITYEEFAKQKQLPQLEQTQAGGVSDRKAVFRSTRSPQAAFELTFEVPGMHVPTAATEGDSESCSAGSEMEISGLLSGAVPFEFHSNTDNSVDPFIGRVTADDWVVRLGGVQRFAAPLLNAYTAGGAGAGPYYLLSHAQGYSFRNRLVHRDNIAREFIINNNDLP